MKRTLVIVAYCVGGLLVAIALTFGAFALAGKDIGTPAGGHINLQRGEEIVPVPESTRPSPKPEGSPGESIESTEGDDDHAGGSSETPGPSPTRTEGGGGGSGDSADSGSGDSGSHDSGSEDGGGDD